MNRKLRGNDVRRNIASAGARTFRIPGAFTIGIAVLTWVGLALSPGNVRASENPAGFKAVVELFTSQGCSSCPPADALLKRYVDRDDVIALSMPVDYWDYLGWKDTFARGQYSQRQRAYARARGDGQVYTPQVVVNGLAHAVGSRASEIENAIEVTNSHLAKGGRVPVSIHMEGSTLVVATGDAAAGAAVRSATIWLALVRKTGDVQIRRGENGGRHLRYFNIVRDLRKVGTWKGRAKTIRVAGVHSMAEGIDGCTVILQKGSDGPIIGAAELKSW